MVKGESMEQKIEPITASADGKRNAYYLKCDVHGQNRPYAACLSIAARTGDPVVKAIYEGCLGAIRNRSCPAVQMRESELLEGKAIFFLERQRSGTTPVTEFIAAVKHAVPGPVVVSKPKDELDIALKAASDGYADTITKAIATHEVAPPKPAIQVKPGESPLEAARRIIAMRNAQSKG